MRGPEAARARRGAREEGGAHEKEARKKKERAQEAAWAAAEEVCAVCGSCVSRARTLAFTLAFNPRQARAQWEARRDAVKYDGITLYDLHLNEISAHGYSGRAYSFYAKCCQRCTAFNKVFESGDDVMLERLRARGYVGLVDEVRLSLGTLASKPSTHPCADPPLHRSRANSVNGMAATST